MKKSIKYWLRPDFEHRVQEGSISAEYHSRVVRFSDEGVVIDGPSGTRTLPADAAYVLIGYSPDADLEKRCGIEVDEATLIPKSARPHGPPLLIGSVYGRPRMNRLTVQYGDYWNLWWFSDLRSTSY